MQPDPIYDLVLIERLLKRNVADRIGNLKNGYLDIWNHRFFKEAGVDVKQILKKTAVPPWIPNVTDPLDSQNFDDSSKFEDEIEFHIPLTAEQQAAFAGF